MTNKQLQGVLSRFPDDADLSVAGNFLFLEDDRGDRLATIDLQRQTLITWEDVWVDEDITQPEIIAVENGVVSYIGTGEDRVILPDPEQAVVGSAKTVKTGHFEFQRVVTQII